MSSNQTKSSDEAKLQEDLALIKQVCTDVELDLISLIFHECEYDIDQTIARIHAGDFQDSGWQTAKTNHRKKMVPPPPPAHDFPARPIRFTPPFPRPIPSKVDAVEPVPPPPPSPPSTLDPPAPAPASVEPEEKLSSTSAEKRIPTKPVSVYRALQLSSFPSDIRFGDIQWNDDGPFAVTPTDFITEQQLSSSTDFISQADSTTNPTGNVEVTERVPTPVAPANEPTFVPPVEANSSPFVPFNSTANSYAPPSNDYSATTPSPWSNPTPTYKSTPKTPTNYSPQTPVYHLGNFSYPANSSLVSVVMPLDPWSNNGYTQPLDNYGYAGTNYHHLPTNYSNQQQYYHQQKYDPTNANRDFFANYGQPTATHSDPSANSVASGGKEGPLKSRLSATAAVFQSPFPGATYPYAPGQTHYPSMDTRDHHRQTGSYGNSNATQRSNYYSHRSYSNNSNNWHQPQ